jgi:anionic cell wall polymer biosynthesis LytR-Cps2A-Psr (LCP) family protein
MKRLLLIILAIIVTLIVATGIGFGTFIWRFTPKIPEANYPEPANQTEARLQDLDYLRKFPDVDLSFSEDERTAFYAHMDDMEARAETMSEAQFLMGIAAAAAIS